MFNFKPAESKTETFLNSVEISNKSDNVSENFSVDNLQIFLSITNNTIFLKIYDISKLSNYETIIYEKDIIDNKFKINELYIFILKCLKKEENHSYISKINNSCFLESMTIEMNAILNSYLKLKYDINLKKNNEIKVNEVITKDNNTDTVKLDLLQKKYDNLLEKYNNLFEKYNDFHKLISMCEICIGHAIYDINISQNLMVSPFCDTLNLMQLTAMFPKLPNQITIYFSKIKKLNKLTSITSNKKIPISLYDDKSNTIIDNKYLDIYCNSNKIQIFVI